MCLDWHGRPQPRDRNESLAGRSRVHALSSRMVGGGDKLPGPAKPLDPTTSTTFSSRSSPPAPACSPSTGQLACDEFTYYVGTATSSPPPLPVHLLGQQLLLAIPHQDIQTSTACRHPDPVRIEYTTSTPAGPGEVPIGIDVNSPQLNFRISALDTIW